MGIGIFLEPQNTTKLHTHHYQWVRWVHVPCFWKHVLQEMLLIPTSGILKTCIIKSHTKLCFYCLKPPLSVFIRFLKIPLTTTIPLP